MSVATCPPDSFLAWGVNTYKKTLDSSNDFPGDHSRLDPPDPISNSEVKHPRADDSVRSPHVKVGHCQVLF